jgi:hypothetical protein
MKTPVAGILIALVVLFPISSDAWAWGDQGHKVICQIALRLVHPSTRVEIEKLISTDDRFDSFSDSCIWPDHPRQRASSGNVCGCAGVGRDRAIHAAARGVA